MEHERNIDRNDIDKRHPPILDFSALSAAILSV